MIKRHEFNTEWWGDEVGIVEDPEFFTQPASQIRAALDRFSWVEFVHPVSKLPGRQVLADAGFFYTDTQVRFRIDLSQIQLNPCAAELNLEIASDAPFTIQDDELKVFPFERFYALPNASESKVNERYVRWGNSLIQQNSATCYRFLQDGKVQGWFLSHPESPAINLTLAMLSRNAVTSGFDLYSRALAEYAKKGFRLGMASFSIRNTPVHNIYANLGARFLEPRECWMWIRDMNSEGRFRQRQ
jgi:hypothetical protein